MNKIISAVNYHDYIIIFCENGDIYKMIVNEANPWKLIFQRIAEFRPLP